MKLASGNLYGISHRISFLFSNDYKAKKHTSGEMKKGRTFFAHDKYPYLIREVYSNNFPAEVRVLIFSRYGERLSDHSLLTYLAPCLQRWTHVLSPVTFLPWKPSHSYSMHRKRSSQASTPLCFKLPVSWYGTHSGANLLNFITPRNKVWESKDDIRKARLFYHRYTAVPLYGSFNRCNNLRRH